MLGDKTAIKTKFNVRAFVLGGLWAIFMVDYTTFGRLHNEVDGVIMARHLTTGYRPAAIYSVRDSGGGTHTYVAGATDASLPRDLPIGAHVTKRRWDLGYSVDGQRRDDFPVTFYTIILTIGVCLLWFAAFSMFQERRSSPTTRSSELPPAGAVGSRSP
jgi:hypothetical protein